MNGPAKASSTAAVGWHSSPEPQASQQLSKLTPSAGPPSAGRRRCCHTAWGQCTAASQTARTDSAEQRRLAQHMQHEQQRLLSCQAPVDHTHLCVLAGLRRLAVGAGLQESDDNGGGLRVGGVGTSTPAAVSTTQQPLPPRSLAATDQPPQQPPAGGHHPATAAPAAMLAHLLHAELLQQRSLAGVHHAKVKLELPEVGAAVGSECNSDRWEEWHNRTASWSAAAQLLQVCRHASRLGGG